MTPSSLFGGRLHHEVSFMAVRSSMLRLKDSTRLPIVSGSFRRVVISFTDGAGWQIDAAHAAFSGDA
jgi:hypothetical protein